MGKNQVEITAVRTPTKHELQRAPKMEYEDDPILNDTVFINSVRRLSDLRGYDALNKQQKSTVEKMIKWLSENKINSAVNGSFNQGGYHFSEFDILNLNISANSRKHPSKTAYPRYLIMYDPHQRVALSLLAGDVQQHSNFDIACHDYNTNSDLLKAIKEYYHIQGKRDVRMKQVMTAGIINDHGEIIIPKRSFLAKLKAKFALFNLLRIRF